MPSETWDGPLKPQGWGKWIIPREYRAGMRVPGVIYSDDALIELVRLDRAPEQVVNVACLPGIIGASMAMPDIHLGYGFPIGGVAAMDIRDGVIAPGGIGYDINCGVRLIRSDLTVGRVTPKLRDLVDELFVRVPAGVGSEGKVKIDLEAPGGVLEKGAAWAVEHDFGSENDLDCCEEGGWLKEASIDNVSERALKRGRSQVGTLGSGNHFIEVSAVDRLYDQAAATAFGLFLNQAVFLIHSGSRGLGHQVCTDYLAGMALAMRRYDITVLDRQLACAPVSSPEGRAYLSAMACAANYAWANRQVLGSLVCDAVTHIFGGSIKGLGLEIVYDVAHNIAKIESHMVDGSPLTVCVHRKGATRAFPAGHPCLPPRYAGVGQPVLVPGDMGRNSYVLAGGKASMEAAFGSACHGAGRIMSREAAHREIDAKELRARLERSGIVVRAHGDGALVEESPDVYKDVNAIVEVVHRLEIASKVARLRPLGVIKG